MKAKTMTSSALFMIGGVIFAVAHAQSNAQTANISATGAVATNNGWIGSVTLNNNSQIGGTSYVVNFTGAAPGATSCNVTAATPGLNSRMVNPVSMPNMLVVTFTPSGPNGGSGGVASDFTLTCSVASSAAPQTTAPITTTTTTTTQTTSTASPSPLQGTQTASISSIAGVTNNNGWISSVTFTGVTGYPPNAYIVEFSGRSPGASNCQVSPTAATINGYTFTPGIFDESDGTSVMVRYAPPANMPGGATIPAAQAFTLTCSFPPS